SDRGLSSGYSQEVRPLQAFFSRHEFRLSGNRRRDYAGDYSYSFGYDSAASLKLLNNEEKTMLPYDEP
ncbi:MAG TPA: hypothetical protein VEX68_10600, partial [Bryobacteraceae bacterium]|nr:hypothetical protein [Bryobacteraceae bacterium]